MALDANGDTPIGLQIDSADGTTEAAFVLIDTLDLIRSAVRKLCRGQVGGPSPVTAAVRGNQWRVLSSIPPAPSPGRHLHRKIRLSPRPNGDWNNESSRFR